MALGHPMGATGAFLTCKVLDYLQDPETAGTYGMVTMCRQPSPAPAPLHPSDDRLQPLVEDGGQLLTP